MQETGKFRNKKTNFTPTSNVMLFDTRLDMATKALHNMINYYISIPGFTLYKGHLQSVTGLGQKAFNRMWKQLKETGYLVQHKLKDARGVFYYEYELFDEPLSCDAIPYEVKKEIERVKKVEQVQEEKNEVQLEAQSLEKQKGREHQEFKPDSQKASLVKTRGDQRGAYNKTLQNKTINNNTNKKNKQQQDLVAVYKPHLKPLDSEIIATYQRAFIRKPSPQVSEELAILLRRFEKTVLLYAIEIAGGKGKGYDYAQGILRKLEAYKAYTMDEVFAYEERYYQMG